MLTLRAAQERILDKMWRIAPTEFRAAEPEEMTTSKDSNIAEFRNAFEFDAESGVLRWKDAGREAGTSYRAHRTSYRQVRLRGRNYMVHRIIYMIRKD